MEQIKEVDTKTLVTEREELVFERRTLVDRKLLLEQQMAAIDTNTKKRRDLLAEILWINKTLAAINTGLSQIHQQLKNTPKVEKQKSYTWEILAEILPPEQLEQIKQENYRRKNGEPPRRLQLFEVVENSEKTDTYRALASSFLTELIEARQKLNHVILAGCAKWGNAEFLQMVSAANTALKPIREYEKLKRLNHLK